MKRITFYFDCKHKFGRITASGETEKEAKINAVEKIKNSAWCENRCETCKLKLNKL